MSTDKEYMRQYMARRYKERKQRAIILLGGRCAKCGSIDNLQFDHKDPTSRKYVICKRLAGVSESKLIDEINKCQLLCWPCHNTKTLSERGYKTAKGLHGTISSYRYCKCTACKAAKAAHDKRYRSITQTG